MRGRAAATCGPVAMAFAALVMSASACIPDIDAGGLEIRHLPDTAIFADGSSEVTIEVCNRASEPADSLEVTVDASRGRWLAESASSRETALLVSDGESGCARATWQADSEPGTVRFRASIAGQVLAEHELVLEPAPVAELRLSPNPALLPQSGGVNVVVTIAAFADTGGAASVGSRIDLRLSAEPERTAALGKPFIIVGDESSVIAYVGESASAICVVAEADDGQPVTGSVLIAREAFMPAPGFCDPE